MGGRSVGGSRALRQAAGYPRWVAALERSLPPEPDRGRDSSPGASRRLVDAGQASALADGVARVNDLREQERPEQANSDEEQPDDRQDEWIVEWLVLDAERPGGSAEQIPCRSGHRAGSADDGILGPARCARRQRLRLRSPCRRGLRRLRRNRSRRSARCKPSRFGPCRPRPARPRPVRSRSERPRRRARRLERERRVGSRPRGGRVRENGRGIECGSLPRVPGR